MLQPTQRKDEKPKGVHKKLCILEIFVTIICSVFERSDDRFKFLLSSFESLSFQVSLDRRLKEPSHTLQLRPLTC